MKKKSFLLILAVLTVMCLVAAGILAGCNKHEHAYTKWANDETQHWLVCPDDDAKDESSVANHEFGTNGKCVECGYEKPHTHAYTKWRTSDTEHWKVCPDDNVEQAGSRAPHNFVNGACECGKKNSFTGEVTVDEKFNGKTITLKKDGQTDVTLTVTNGKATLTNVKLGDWTATCNLLGATLKTSVTVEEVMTKLDLSGFTSGTGKIDLTTGAYTWHRQSNETVKVNLVGDTSGDQYVALKIVTGADFLDWTKKYDEMRFGIAMTVNGAEHVINFNWRNWELTNIGFSSDVKNWQTENQDKDVGEVNYRGHDQLLTHLFYPKFDKFDDAKNGWGFGTYGGAIIDGGVYFVLHYESATGNANIYLSDGETYMLVYTEAGLFEKNGKLQGFGVVKGENYNGYAGGVPGGSADREFTFTLGYGAAMNAAVGAEVSEWSSTVNITGNKADVDGANVVADKPAYKYGETATITVTVPTNKIATVTVDGGAPVVLEETGDVTYTAINKTHTVNVVFASDKFSGEVTVNEVFNGKTITLKKDGQTDLELTVNGGKVTLTNVKLGEWTATCDLLGATIQGTVTLADGMTELDLSRFVTGTADMNLANGEFKWYRQSGKTAKVNLAEEASGDQYVAVKIATGSDFLAWANKYDEMHFGIAMTVNGVEHAINFNWRNWQHDNIGFSSDVLNWTAADGGDPHASPKRYRGHDELMIHLFKPKFVDFGNGWEFGTYGGAIIDGGVYFVLHYESATGNANIYLSDGETYMLVYTETELFAKNGKLTAFGVVKGDDYNGYAGGSFDGTADREFTFALGYGATMNAAVGGTVSEWSSTVNITGNKADVDGADVVANKTAYKYGETATITITVPENKIATVTIDGGTPVVLEATDTITITVAKTEYTVSVVFASDKFSGEVTVDEAYNGKTITLKKDGQTDVELTVAGGKVTLTNVKLGEWTAICNLLGSDIKGTVTLADGMTELDLSGFNAGTADIDLTTGAFVYTSKKNDAPTVNVNLAEAKTGDTYVGLKISTDNPWNDWTISNFEELHLGVWMTVGDSKHWIELHWRNWEQANFAINTDISHDNSNSSTEILKNNLWKPVDGFVWDTNHGWTAMPFGEAFCGEGIYLIMKYESATGNVDVLLAKNDGYVNVCTFEKLFAANSEVKAFGVGSIGEDFDYHNCPGGFKIDCVLSIGSSLSDVTGTVLSELQPAEPQE